MKLINGHIKIGNRKVFFSVIIWYILAATAAVLKLRLGESKYNNFMIFRYVFWHTIHRTNLYSQYPSEYFDTNHYGPFFSLIIAPFAIMPVPLGCFFWCMANAAILLYAVRQLPVSFKHQNAILLIGAVEMMTSVENTQFNPIMTSWIILTFVLVQKEKDVWATLFIVAGTLVKLYGIVGICFFLFSKHRIKFILSFIFWLGILVFLPMVISSFSFVVQSYVEWYDSLMQKNRSNLENNEGINLSVMGLISRIFKITLSNIIVLIPAGILYVLPFLRVKQYKNLFFKLYYLAFILIGVVIYSTSAESATYIIAMIGVGIWFIFQENSAINIALLIFALVLTSLSPTDFFPRSIKTNLIFPYGLKALPCFFIWISLLYYLLTKNFMHVKSVDEKDCFSNNSALQ